MNVRFRIMWNMLVYCRIANFPEFWKKWGKPRQFSVNTSISDLLTKISTRQKF
jgi:hypothetical protein